MTNDWETIEVQSIIDENATLRTENEEFKKALMELKEIGDYQEGRIKELSDENDQLQQQIQQLQHWNKCLAEKRHQELSYKSYTASKSEKELKELLEPKLFNCSDNIKSDRYD